MVGGFGDVWTARFFDFDDRLQRLNDLGDQLEVTVAPKIYPVLSSFTALVLS